MWKLYDWNDMLLNSFIKQSVLCVKMKLGYESFIPSTPSNLLTDQNHCSHMQGNAH